MAGHVEKARDYSLAGYNCAQAVACAFADEMGMTVDQAALLASGFGSGMGMRQVCGAISGAVMVYSCLRGYNDPEDQIAKSHHYARVLQFSLTFQEKWNTVICRDLLAALASQTEDADAPEYYKIRPCVRFVESAAQILEDMLS